MKILHLKLKKKWFDMIASGEKKEEYRDVKAFWWSRLIEYGDFENFEVTKFKHYDAVLFVNGYSKQAPQVLIDCKGIIISHGKPEWGAEGKQFIIKLGERLPLTEKTNA